jgi:2-alkenal reductase
MKKPLFLLAVLALVFSTLACQAITLNAQSNNNNPIPTLPAASQAPAQQDPQVSVPPALTNNVTAVEETLVALYERVSPGIVSISVITSDGGGVGSGFVIDTDGHIVTNYHVVENAETVEVDFISGYKVYGDVVGTDLDSDLAVIKVDAPASELHPVPLGDSDKLKVGQTLVAIGNPYGLTSTMTVGIVSATGRSLESIRQTSEGSFFTAGDIIQTDAAINPGNSGGPLLNLNGEVIGVNRAVQLNTAAATGESLNSGIGFAVSVNIVRRVVPALIENGSFDYPYLGMTSLEEVSLSTAELLGLPQATGAYITSVVPGGPADQAGLVGGSRSTEAAGLDAGGDLIIGIDGRPVIVFGDVLSYLFKEKSPGDQIVLTILRDNQQKEVTVTLGKRP